MQISASPAATGRDELVVFSDDWGRHPSSCQHLVRALLPRYDVVWINTIGTRTPHLDRLTLVRAAGKLSAWASPRRSRARRSDGANPRVLEPVMWPSFRSSLARRINHTQLERAIGRGDGRHRIALTTLPLVADLVGSVPVDRWVYYCVDDLAAWPGLDARTLRELEARLVERVDTVVVVNEVLRQRMAAAGRSATVLTHGVDLDHWRRPATADVAALAGLEPPLIVFWGVVDRRLRVDWVRALESAMTAGTIVLVGPANQPDPALARLPRVVRTGPLHYRQLPAVAAHAAALVMPYDDTAATRAIQPLKLKEYLATSRPVVTSPLPAVTEWADACDVVETAAGFVETVLARAAQGLPDDQHRARRRLEGESWARKAERFDALLRSPGDPRRPGTGLRSSPLVLHTRLVTGTGGGPDKTILHSPRHLEEFGYRSLCAYMRDPADDEFAALEERARQLGAPLRTVDDLGPLDWRLPDRWKRLCRELRPAIWHAHDYKSNLMGLLVRRSLPMRLVTTVHGWVKHTARTPLYYAVDRRCLRRYERVICVSPDLYDACLESGVPRQRCRLIANAIDTEEYRRRRSVAAAKTRLGTAPDRLLIGAFGRLSEEKGLDLLIRAAARLDRAALDWELWIAGEGDRQPELERLVAELGLSGRVRLLGFRSDLRELYEALDLFVLASRREGLPNTLLEAMAYEVPVLATRVGGVPRLVRDGDTGLLAEAGSGDALLPPLERLASDAELRQRLGRAGRRAVIRCHGFERRMERIREIYDELLSERKAAA